MVREGRVDEIELLAELLRQLSHVCLEERAVVETARVRARHLDHSRRKVDADYLAARDMSGDLTELAAWAAAEIENARVGREKTANHVERLSKYGRRERTHEAFVQLRHLVEVLDQVGVPTRPREHVRLGTREMPA